MPHDIFTLVQTAAYHAASLIGQRNWIQAIPIQRLNSTRALFYYYSSVILERLNYTGGMRKLRLYMNNVELRGSRVPSITTELLIDMSLEYLETSVLMISWCSRTFYGTGCFSNVRDKLSANRVFYSVLKLQNIWNWSSNRIVTSILIFTIRQR